MPITCTVIYEALDQIVENGYTENFDFSGKTIYDVDPYRILIDLNRIAEEFDDLSDLNDEKFVLLGIMAWQLDRRPT